MNNEIKPKITIVILNWNRKDDTIACLKTIRRLVVYGFDLSIIVVDNASDDGSLEALAKITDPAFKVIENKENFGYAKGNNIGITQALEDGADYVLVLNNDTLVDKGLVSQLFRTIIKDPKIGIVSPKIYFAPGYEFHKDRYQKQLAGKIFWYAGGKIDWANVYGENIGVDDVDRGQYDSEKEIDFATGTCILIRKEVFKDIGLFDEKYYMYFEDVEFSLKAGKKDWKIIYVPSAVVWHKVAQSSGIGSNLNDYFISRNRLLFGFKYAPLRTKLALLRESVRLILNGRRWQKKGIRDYYAKKLARGSFSK